MRLLPLLFLSACTPQMFIVDLPTGPTPTPTPSQVPSEATPSPSPTDTPWSWASGPTSDVGRMCWTVRSPALRESPIFCIMRVGQPWEMWEQQGGTSFSSIDANVDGGRYACLADHVPQTAQGWAYWDSGSVEAAAGVTTTDTEHVWFIHAVPSDYVERQWYGSFEPHYQLWNSVSEVMDCQALIVRAGGDPYRLPVLMTFLKWSRAEDPHNYFFTWPPA